MGLIENIGRLFLAAAIYAAVFWSWYFLWYRIWPKPGASYRPLGEILGVDFNGGNGRSGRLAFFVILLALEVEFFLTVFGLVLPLAALLPHMFFARLAFGSVAALTGVFFVAAAIFLGFSNIFRRLHDIDRSGWWVVPLWILPSMLGDISNKFPDMPWLMWIDVARYVLLAWGVIWFFFWPGTKGANRYGEPSLPIQWRVQEPLAELH